MRRAKHVARSESVLERNARESNSVFMVCSLRRWGGVERVRRAWIRLRATRVPHRLLQNGLVGTTGDPDGRDRGGDGDGVQRREPNRRHAALRHPGAPAAVPIAVVTRAGPPRGHDCASRAEKEEWAPQVGGGRPAGAKRIAVASSDASPKITSANNRSSTASGGPIRSGAARHVRCSPSVQRSTRVPKVFVT